jgi:hypothetical protein
MHKCSWLAVFVAICILFHCHKTLASDSLYQKTPVAVLVQLRSEHNRIQALTDAKNYDGLAQVKKDAVGVQKAMTNDFTDNFDFCPVYYYMDTNLTLVLQKKFDGVLMNADGLPAKKIAISESDNKYLIVFYGYPVEQSRRKEEVAEEHGHADSGEPMGEGLIINNSQFHQVSFLYKFGYENLLFRIFHNRRYFYISKKFDMEYFPFAHALNTKLYEGNEKIRIKHFNGMTDNAPGEKK